MTNSDIRLMLEHEAGTQLLLRRRSHHLGMMCAAAARRACLPLALRFLTAARPLIACHFDVVTEFPPPKTRLTFRRKEGRSSF